MQTEFTLSNGRNEVMVNIENDGTVIGIYTYKDCNVWHENFETGIQTEVSKRWKEEKNPLFIHCAKNQLKNAIKRLLDNDNTFVFCLDPTEENFERDFVVISNMLKKYSIKTGTTVLVGC